MAKLTMKEMTDRRGMVMPPDVRVIVVSAQHGGAVQIFLITFLLRFFLKPNLASPIPLLGAIGAIST